VVPKKHWYSGIWDKAKFLLGKAWDNRADIANIVSTAMSMAAPLLAEHKLSSTSLSVREDYAIRLRRAKIAIGNLIPFFGDKTDPNA